MSAPTFNAKRSSKTFWREAGRHHDALPDNTAREKFLRTIGCRDALELSRQIDREMRMFN